MRINADSFVSVGICILGLVGVGYAIGVHSKMKVMESRVGTAVKAQYDAISDGVADQIAKNVARIDESKLKKEVVQKAKEQIAEKFDDKLDDLLEEFNGNLQNVGKIYKSIARSFSKEDI